ncbi:hypothetical protein VTJ04DRAFT_9929 [Mycothermus thermophilus]|uniref:uncharacterized protein n=1 Tax=Humicola insolens TaxID=85995 RepID=UPI0037431255
MFLSNTEITGVIPNSINKGISYIYCEDKKKHRISEPKTKDPIFPKKTNIFQNRTRPTTKNIEVSAQET